MKSLLEKARDLLGPAKPARGSVPVGDGTLEERVKQLEERNRFLLFELRRVNEELRWAKLGTKHVPETDQTKSSFDYQWKELRFGHAMSTNEEFMSGIKAHLCQMTGLPEDWFAGKKVMDVGCGEGRFSLGLLSMGAHVTSVDQSPNGLARVKDLCAEYGDKSRTLRDDLLDWKHDETYDLVFCFGVTHHTGNTYKAIASICKNVAPGGKLFLMIYGFPTDPEDFVELNSYETLRWELRNHSLDEKKQIILERFGEEYANGWFDAVSPRINDLLTWEEIVDFLRGEGFGDVQRNIDARNHHLIATRK